MLAGGAAAAVKTFTSFAPALSLAAFKKTFLQQAGLHFRFGVRFSLQYSFPSNPHVAVGLLVGVRVGVLVFIFPLSFTFTIFSFSITIIRKTIVIAGISVQIVVVIRLSDVSS